MLVCKVVIRKLPFALDYLAVDGDSCEDYAFGTLVEVPYRNVMAVGIVVATTDRLSVAKGKAKKIAKRGSDIFSLGGQQRFLNAFCTYYAASMAELLQMIVPKEAWVLVNGFTGQWYQACCDKIVPRSTLTAAGWKLHEWLVANGPTRSTQMIAAGFRQVTIDQCEQKRMVEQVASLPHPPVDQKSLAPELSPSQQEVFDAVVSPSSQSIHYIHGVTGSGKTYLYIALAQHAMRQGGQVLLLVPEIGLTPQLHKKLLTFFLSHEVAILHSGLSDQQRVRVWQDCCDETVKLLVGTRSALFAPLPKLELMIVDEEHDLSYKQMSQIRYSARGVCFMRAKAQGCRLVLGSATPSLACLRQVQEGLLSMHRLSTRYHGAGLPRVSLVDVSAMTLEVGFSQVAIDAVSETLAVGKRVLIFINRRGYAPCLWCPGCDQNKLCSGCDRPLTYHQTDKALACHRCQVVLKMQYRCDSCGLDTCVPIGQGTEKVALFMQERFPDVPVVKMDRDSCKTWKQLESTLAVVHTPGPKVIVATQMMVKGHHIEDLDTVVVMGVDQSLHSKDFKAQEYLLAQMAQVIGRSGRGDDYGSVLIQTSFSDHPLWPYVVNHAYDDGAEYLLAQRQSYGLPPYSYQVGVYVSHKRQDVALSKAQQLSLTVQRLYHGLLVMGPMSTTVAKISGQHRVVLLFQSADRARLQALVNRLPDFLGQDRIQGCMVIERDPVEF